VNCGAFTETLLESELFGYETSSEVSAQHLPESMSTASRMRPMTNFPDEGFDLEIYVEGLQKGFLEEALRRTNGVQVKAAELLHVLSLLQALHAEVQHSVLISESLTSSFSGLRCRDEIRIRYNHDHDLFSAASD